MNAALHRTPGRTTPSLLRSGYSSELRQERVPPGIAMQRLEIIIAPNTVDLRPVPKVINGDGLLKGGEGGIAFAL